jgi:tetratricopeptide (TPR) repeat protein
MEKGTVDRWARITLVSALLLAVVYFGALRPLLMRPAPESPSGQTPTQLVERGLASINSGAHDEALRLCNEGLRLGADAARANFCIGWASHGKGDLAAAESHYLTAAGKNPDAEIGYFTHHNLGEIYRQKGRHEEAVTQYRMTLQRNSWTDWEPLGQELGILGRHAEALDALRRAAQLNPNEGGVHYQLGLELWRGGDKVEAEKEFQLAIARNASFADPIARLKAQK